MGTWQTRQPTALVLMRDGTRLYGHGVGATGIVAGEVCFNTAMTGYQEILTDPSYAGQIVTFTFPHIGNVGANDEDIETVNLAAAAGVRGVIVRADITAPSNYRAGSAFDDWLKSRSIVGLAGLDTRALTAAIRTSGMSDAALAHAPDGRFDEAAMQEALDAFPGLEGLDLATDISTAQTYRWDETSWRWNQGYGRQDAPQLHVVAIDYGTKRNILRRLADEGAAVTVVSAAASAADILALEPDGIFLSNGPGDPAATAATAVPVIRALIATGKPVFGICFGHQLLGLALGAKTKKMHQGHHGANHPVKDLTTGKVEIVSMNHGFAVDAATLPEAVTETHRSLFDGSNCGLAVEGQPVFSVQYHPEASPGPHDSRYLFRRFANEIRAAKGIETAPEIG